MIIDLNSPFHIFSKWTLLFSLIALYFYIIVIPVNVMSQDSKQNEAMDAFKEWYSGVKTFSADFHQFTFNPVWGQEQEASGVMWFKKPGNMRWEYKVSQKDIIVVNAQGLFWYTPEDHQLIIKTKDEISQNVSPISFLGENMDIEKDFIIQGTEKTTKGNKVLHIILLKPKCKETGIEGVKIMLEDKVFSLFAIEVKEHSGSHNRIEFEKIKTNPETDSALFGFSPPPGTKIITSNDLPF